MPAKYLNPGRIEFDGKLNSVEDAKQAETRKRRIEKAIEQIHSKKK